MDLFEEFSALIQALEQGNVPYAVAGGLAVAIWGVPRATQDIDLLVPQASIDPVLEIARRCGFTIDAFPMKFRDGTEIRRVSKPDAGSMLTLDLLIASGNLEPAWQSRQRVSTGGGELWVVSREALIRMKTAAGRPQDLADVERLTEIDR